MANYLGKDISITEMIKALSGLKHRMEKELSEAEGNSEIGKCQKCSLVWMDKTPKQPNRDKKRYDLYLFSKESLEHREKMVEILKETIKSDENIADIYKKETYFMKVTTKSISRKKMVSICKRHFLNEDIKIIETKMVRPPDFRERGKSRLPRKKFYFVENLNQDGNTINLEGNGNRNDVLKKFF